MRALLILGFALLAANCSPADKGPEPDAFVQVFPQRSVDHVEFTPNGETLIVASSADTMLTHGQGETGLACIDLDTNEIAWAVDLRPYGVVRVSEDGQVILNSSGTEGLFRVEDGSEIKPLNRAGLMTFDSADLLANSNIVVSGGDGGTNPAPLQAINARTGDPIGYIDTGIAGTTQTVSVHRLPTDSNRAVVVLRNISIEPNEIQFGVLDPASMALTQTFPIAGRAVDTDVAGEPAILGVADMLYAPHLYDVESGALIKTLEAAERVQYSVVLTDDGQYALGRWGHEFFLWSTQTGALLSTTVLDKDAYEHPSEYAVSPDGQTLVTGHFGGGLYVWSMETFFGLEDAE
jgi:WD40 repeat protein